MIRCAIVEDELLAQLVGHLLAIPNLPASADDLGSRFVSTLNRWVVAGAVAAALFGLLLIIAVAKRIVGPVEELTAAVRSMARGDLAQRIDVRSRDELGTLAQAFNSMAASLERSERTRRNMVGDIAHELRTPLTNVRCQIEALQDRLIEPSAEGFVLCTKTPSTSAG